MITNYCPNDYKCLNKSYRCPIKHICGITPKLRKNDKAKGGSTKNKEEQE